MMRVISESFFEEGPQKRWWARAAAGTVLSALGRTCCWALRLMMTQGPDRFLLPTWTTWRSWGHCWGGQPTSHLGGADAAGAGAGIWHCITVPQDQRRMRRRSTTDRHCRAAGGAGKELTPGRGYLTQATQLPFVLSTRDRQSSPCFPTVSELLGFTIAILEGKIVSILGHPHWAILWPLSCTWGCIEGLC